MLLTANSRSQNLPSPKNKRLLAPRLITSLKAHFGHWYHFLEPQARHQKRTSAPNLVASTYIPSPFALRLNNISNVHAVLPTQSTCLAPLDETVEVCLVHEFCNILTSYFSLMSDKCLSKLQLLSLFIHSGLISTC